MAKFFIVRHGETNWNKHRRVLGWSKTPLNEKGTSQAHRLAKLLSPLKVDALYTSPLPRALQTAKILGACLRKKPISEPFFTEANIGGWEGLFWKDLADDTVRKNYYNRPTTARPPNGETFSEVLARAVSGMEKLLKKDPNGSFMIVTHADLVRCVLSHYLGVNIRIVRKFWIEHASLTAMTINTDGTTLHFLNLFRDSVD